jgi:anti-anti-sigma factor
MQLPWDSLSIQVAEQLKDLLLDIAAEEKGNVTLDLGNINKIDLSAIQLLLSLKKTLVSKGYELYLSNCTNSVLDAIAITGCLEHFEFAHE